MATYTWNGNGFNEGELNSQFMLDFYNNLYLYDQNYQGFFPIAFDSQQNPIYDGDSQFVVKFIPPSTQFSQAFGYTEQQLNDVTMEILNGRLEIFKKTNSNIVDIYTQTPASFVGNTVTQALSGFSTSEALNNFAPNLVNLNLNFGLQDMLKWANGPDLVKKLTNLLANHQNTLNDVNKGLQSISDFKKKLVKRQVLLANKLRENQATADNLINKDSFGSLQKSFPTEFNNIKNVLNNSNNSLSGKIASILPKNLGGGSVQNVVNNAINNVVASNTSSNGVPNIFNPIDKFMVDISNLENKSGLSNTITNIGFSNLESQFNFTNQAINILNNIVSKLPVVPSVAASALETDASKINDALTEFYKNKLNQGILNNNNTQNSNSQKAIDSLYKLMKIKGPTQIANPITGIVDNNDSANGGNILNLGVFNNLFGGENDPSLTAPNVSLSPDPAIQNSQNDKNLEQNSVDQPGKSNLPKKGSGFNQLEEISHRPRNKPINATLGDYNVSKGIQI